MEKKHENTVWVPHAETLPEPAGPGVTRRVLAYNKGLMCVENRQGFFYEVSHRAK